MPWYAMTTHTSGSSLKVEGEITIWLEGVLVRNSPVHISIEGVPSIHWLDGLAMLHALPNSCKKSHGNT
jgi:carotenoid cleavage dioxygenase-like enzyme